MFLTVPVNSFVPDTRFTLICVNNSKYSDYYIIVSKFNECNVFYVSFSFIELMVESFTLVSMEDRKNKQKQITRPENTYNTLC